MNRTPDDSIKTIETGALQHCNTYMSTSLIDAVM